MRALGWLGWAVLGSLTGCATASVGGQRYLAKGGPDLTGWQLARESPLAGPLSYEMQAVVRHGARDQPGVLAGAGADLALLSGHTGAPYLIGGLQLGIGTRDHPSTWASWSLGSGAQVLAVGGLGLRLEGRYRRMSASDRRGVELGFRIGRRCGREGTRADPRPVLSVPRLDTASAGGGAAGARRLAVVRLATETMGSPYRWGGTDANGFDCSGLIQFAYAEVGIMLPRRSADQARAGVAVDREISTLLPGDILTFATQGGAAVSHVGLYLGEGRFIHSATGGVQVSQLNATDPYGRWWWQRWVGVRRVVM